MAFNLNVTDVLVASLLLALPVAFYLQGSFFTQPDSPFLSPLPLPRPSPPPEEEKSEPKSIMQAERSDLAPPKDDPFTLDQLKQFDGSDPSKPIYVAIKGARLSISVSIVDSAYSAMKGLCSMFPTSLTRTGRESRTTCSQGKMHRRHWGSRVSSLRTPYQTTVICRRTR